MVPGSGCDYSFGSGCAAAATTARQQPLCGPMASQDPKASELLLSRSEGKQPALYLDPERHVKTSHSVTFGSGLDPTVELD